MIQSQIFSIHSKFYVSPESNPNSVHCLVFYPSSSVETSDLNFGIFISVLCEGLRFSAHFLNYWQSFLFKYLLNSSREWSQCRG